GGAARGDRARAPLTTGILRASVTRASIDRRLCRRAVLPDPRRWIMRLLCPLNDIVPPHHSCSSDVGGKASTVTGAPGRRAARAGCAHGGRHGLLGFVRRAAYQQLLA